VPSRRSSRRSPSESPPLPELAKPASGQLRHGIQPEQRGRQMTGRKGPGSEEAPITQPTNVPTPAEPVPHQTRCTRPSATSAPSCRSASAPRHHHRWRAAPE
jgi:hypothetical protein